MKLRLVFLRLVVPLLAVSFVALLFLSTAHWSYRRCLFSMFTEPRGSTVCIKAVTHRQVEQLMPLVASDAALPQSSQAVQHVHLMVVVDSYGVWMQFIRCSVSQIRALSPTSTIHVWVSSRVSEEFLIELKLNVGESVVQRIDLGMFRESPWKRWLQDHEEVTADAQMSSDIYRYLLLRKFGGIYLDVDVVPLRRELFHIPAPALFEQHIGSLAYRLNPALLVLSAEDPALDALERRFMELAEHHWSLRTTGDRMFGLFGPYLLTRVWADTRRVFPWHLVAAEVTEPPNFGVFKCPADDRQAALHFKGFTKKKFLALASCLCPEVGLRSLDLE